MDTLQFVSSMRVLLTQQMDTAQYLATYEEQYRNTEKALFFGLDTSLVDRSGTGFPDDQSVTSPNNKVTVLNGNSIKQGPALILKVMSGDKVKVSTQYYYSDNGSHDGTLQTSNILNSLAGGLYSITMGTHGAYGDLSNGTTSPLVGALSSFLSDPAVPADAGKPKAYLNYVLLDNQFNYVSGPSGALQVQTSGTSNGQLQSPLMTSVPITKSGYLYIYLSNASNQNVYFDNLSVVHYSGPMVEENHYYPFGLAMAGISDKAFKGNYAENKYRFNKGSELQNKEFVDGSGLELYETPLRSLDPQLGRWWQIDSKPTEAESPYSAMGNNPILRMDPLGDSAGDPKAQQSNHWYSNLHFRPAEPGQYDLHPATAFLADVSYNLADFLGLTEAEKTIRTVADPKASVVDKGLAIIRGSLAMTRGEEGGPVEKEPVKAYEVGMTKDLWARSEKGDGLAVHHAPQGKPASQIIEGYDYQNAPGIVLPDGEHRRIPTYKGETIAGTPRQQLAKDFRDLRSNTNAPNSSLQQLIELNKVAFPELFQK